MGPARHVRVLVAAVAFLLMGALAVLTSSAQQAARPAKAEAKARALPKAAQAAIDSVDPERIRAHVRFLSHDLLEGRGTGQRGGDLAAQYIATQFALYGLEPAGDDGSFLQSVPLVGVETEPSTTMSLHPREGRPMKLTFADDFVTTNETLTRTTDVEGGIVWVGYGIHAPEYGWDDYGDHDVKGKVLLMLVSEPPSKDADFFKGPALTYYGRWTYKYEEAARRGAAGVLLVHETDMASYGWDVVRNSWTGERSYLRNGAGGLKAASWIQLEVARQLVAGSGMNLEHMMQQAQSRDFRPVELGARMAARVITRLREFEADNVVARLPGSDPKLRGQAVIYSAHFDHLGVRTGPDGEPVIYNGAVDNASGTAMLLEMARALARAPQAPPRSILFAAVTAEEQGLRGSEFLGRNSPVPPGSITLNLNFDGIPPLGIPEHVELTGAERTTFFPVTQATARDFGLEVQPDANPSAGLYYRSDHFSFARVGVPAFSVKQGRKFRGQPLAWGAQQAADYTRRRYHQPGDEYNEDMDFRGNALLSRFGIALGWRAAMQPGLVSWLPGDEFEPARKRSQQAAAGGQ
jgi:Zn-dependent M28 family amino/carboxypeptidase